MSTRQNSTGRSTRESQVGRDRDQRASLPNDSDVLWRIARNGSDLARREVAYAPFPLDEDLLDHMARTGGSAITEGIASRQQPLSDRVLATLYASSSLWTRLAVVQRRQPLPKEVLVKASRPSEELEILLTVVNRDDLTDEDVLCALLTYPDEGIRERVAQRIMRRELPLHPRCVAVAVDDPSPIVRAHLLSALIPEGSSTATALADTDLETWQRAGIVALSSSVHLLRACLNESDPELCIAAIRNPMTGLTPADVQRLRNSKNPAIAAAAAEWFLRRLA